MLHLSDNNKKSLYISIPKNKQIDNNKKVIVHCKQGRSRSVAVIIGYLMKYHKYNFDDAYNMLKEKKKEININENFKNQLDHYFFL